MNPKHLERAVLGVIMTLVVFSCIAIRKTFIAKNYRAGIIAYLIGCAICFPIVHGIAKDNTISDSVLVAFIWSFLGYCFIYPFICNFSSRNKK
jgi:hypothetical protein